MSRIRGKNTKPEILVRKYLHHKGLRFRIHRRDLPGNPDIVLPKYSVAIFVNGCFWHGHEGCRYFVIPKTRTQWWVEKIDKTRENDLSNITELQKLGWKVEVIWECELKSKTVEKTLQDLDNFLRNLPIR